MNHILLAWKNVLRNRRRSFVTIFIAAVGCASILIAGGFALWTYDILIEGASREFGHITVADKSFFAREEETPMQFGMRQDNRVAEYLENNPEVATLLPRINYSGLISNGDKSLIFLGTGAELAREAAVRKYFLVVRDGAIPQGEPSQLPQILLGVALARNLGAKVGSQLTLIGTTAATGGINAVDVEVAALVSTGWSEVDKRLVFSDIETAQNLLMTDKISTLSVFMHHLDKVPAMLETLAAYDGEHAYMPWWEQAHYYHSVRALYNRIFGLLGMIIIALVLFSVINTLAMAVVERTREIGTLRALGAHPREIIAQFVREGGIIGLAGVMIGNLVAAAVIWTLPYLHLQMPPPPGRSEGYPLLVAGSPTLTLVTNALIVLLCMGAAWAVSRRAASKPIVDALGHV
jgi:putative ABC transport system permease protein